MYDIYITSVDHQWGCGWLWGFYDGLHTSAIGFYRLDSKFGGKDEGSLGIRWKIFNSNNLSVPGNTPPQFGTSARRKVTLGHVSLTIIIMTIERYLIREPFQELCMYGYISI